MMRILVAQMTRMGDMIQTTPLLRTLRRMYPDAHITAMIRKMSKGLAERNPDIDDVIVYSEDEMFLDVCSQDSDRLLKAYRDADGLIGSLREARFDICFNCTHSIASAMLFKLAGIPKVIGAHLSDDWQFILRGSWVTYFFTSVFYRQYNALNLCDIMRNFAADEPAARELRLGVSDDDRTFVADLLRDAGIGEDDFVVCFQLGASENRKRWAENRFAALGKRLVQEKNARVLLLGVAEEAPFGQNFEREAPGIAVHLFGKTSIPQVGALLERARMLVTNDTGTMHIAAAVRCPVVLLSIGHVHFRETGPYGSGHYAIERRRPTLGPADWSPGGIDEAGQLDPELVWRVIDRMAPDSGEPESPPMEADDSFSDLEVYRSRFAPDGCLEWYPMVRRALTQTDFLRIAYRAMWLDHMSSKQAPRAERTSLSDMLHCFAAPEESVDVWRSSLTKEYEGLADLSQRGIRATEKVIHGLKSGESMRKVKDQVGELSRLDDEIRLYGDLHEPCKPLVVISRYERDNLEGADPLHLSQTTLQIYRDCFARARLMSKKLAAVAEVWNALPN